MAGQDHSRYQQGIIRRYYEHKDTIALQSLSEIVSDLYLAEGAQVRKLWDRARAALVKIAGDDPRTATVLASRDVQALARYVNELSASVRSDAASPAQSAEPVAEQIAPEPADRPNQNTSEQATEQVAAPTPDQLKRAMKAFRKRMKLKRLDDESKLGRSPLSSGKQSMTVAIMAPREYPQTVWDELVAQGKLKRSGAFYELVK